MGLCHYSSVWSDSGTVTQSHKHQQNSSFMVQSLFFSVGRLRYNGVIMTMSRIIPIRSGWKYSCGVWTAGPLLTLVGVCHYSIIWLDTGIVSQSYEHQPKSGGSKSTLVLLTWLARDNATWYYRDANIPKSSHRGKTSNWTIKPNFCWCVWDCATILVSDYMLEQWHSPKNINIHYLWRVCILFVVLFLEYLTWFLVPLLAPSDIILLWTLLTGQFILPL